MKRSLCGFVAMIFLCLTTTAQDVLWVREVRGTDSFVVNRNLGMDAQGNLYCYGHFNGTCDFDPGQGTYFLHSVSPSLDLFLSKLDKDGNFIWAKSIGSKLDEWPGRLILDSFGNIYLSGSYRDTIDLDPGVNATSFAPSSGGPAGFLLKLDSSGNYVWAKTFPTEWNSSVTDTELDSKQNIYITGSFMGTCNFDPDGAGHIMSNGIYANLFIAKYDAGGDFLWASDGKGISGARSAGVSVTVDAFDAVYLGGTFKGTVNFASGSDTTYLTSAVWNKSDKYICKFNDTGTLLWARQMSGSESQSPAYVKADRLGNLFVYSNFTDSVDADPGVAQNILKGGGLSDMFFSKIDPATGNLIWVRHLGKSGLDMISSISIDKAGSIYVSGTFSDSIDFDPGIDVSAGYSPAYCDNMLLKFTAWGHLTWARQTLGTYQCGVWSLLFDTSGALYTIGSYSGDVNFDPAVSTVMYHNPTAQNMVVVKFSNEIIATAINDLSESNMMILPNPTTGAVHFVFPQITIGELSIYDLQGQPVRNPVTINTSSAIVDIPGPAGIYIASFKRADGSISTTKVIKHDF